MKINSFKIIKYIFYILCIISLFFSIKSRVYALDYTNNRFFVTSDNNVQTDGVNEIYFVTKSFIGISTTNFNFTSDLTSNDDYLIGSAFAYTTTGSIMNSGTISNVNWSTTCSARTSAYETDMYQTIHYQDGSTAVIDTTQWTEFCSQYNTSVALGITTSETFHYLDTQNRISVTLSAPNGNRSMCEVNSNGMFKCPLKSGINYKNLIVQAYNGGANTSIKYGVRMAYMTTKDNVSTIINNQNQNTNIINNSIQDTNNTLKDDDVSNNESSDTISSIGDTFDTENDFLLGLLTIPYNFFNGLVNIFENNCTSLNLGSMFGEDLVFPCLSLSSLLGDVFTNVIDVIFCGVVMSAFLRRIVKYYQALLSLDERATQIGGVKIW